MSIIIDNVPLDENNSEFNYAAEFVKHTDKLVYLTGKAGTGKTMFLKYLRETTAKNTVVLAPTGVAAINAGGQTINSFFQIKPSVYIPNDKRLRTHASLNDLDRSTVFDYFKYQKDRIQIIKGLELLIIDEISMVRCDLLDVVDRLLRVFRKRVNEPFGGVQVILIGDTFQLPPIADFQQWEILQQFYESPFFFSSKVIEKNKPIYIELKKIYRQNEQEFIDLLNRVRINQLTVNELNLLNSKYNPTFLPKENSNYINLETHKSSVDLTNLTKLNELSTELKLFDALVSGTFPDNIMPTDKVLQLKVGAQIMFIKNDRAKRFFNGKIAVLTKIENDRIFVEFSEGNVISVEKENWENVKFTWNDSEKRIEEEVIGRFYQYPIKLAWAITVHKSQGLTFEKVIANLSSAFTSGQVYVALSRCTTFNGLVLKTKIEPKSIITDPRVLEFAQNETPNTLIVQELNSGKADFYYKKVRESIKRLEFDNAYDNLLSAIKFRNDIDTEGFKRIFLIIARRAFSYKSKLENSEKVVEDIDIALKNITSENKTLLENNSYQEDQIVEINRLNKILIDKTNDFEVLLANKDDFISRIESKLTSAEETISGKSEVINRLENQILKLNHEILKTNEDIIKLNVSNKFLIDKSTDFELLLKKKDNLISSLKSKFATAEKSISEDVNKNIKLQKQNLKLNQEILIKNEEISRLSNLKWYHKLIAKNRTE